MVWALPPHNGRARNHRARRACVLKAAAAYAAVNLAKTFLASAAAAAASASILKQLDTAVAVRRAGHQRESGAAAASLTPARGGYRATSRSGRLLRMKNIMLCLALVLGAGTAQAQYRCVADGKTTYQQAPCSGGQAVNTSGAGRGDPSSPATQQARREVAWAQRQGQIDISVASGQVFIGMTGGEAMKPWGAPHKVNRTVTASGSREQWIYKRPGIGWDQYLYVDNGLVSAVQTSR